MPAPTAQAPAPTDQAPAPTDRAGLRRGVLAKQRAYGRARRAADGAGGASGAGLGGRLAKGMAWWEFQSARANTVRPLRALNHYNLRLGPLLASGIGMAMFFSITSLLTTGFSVAALALRTNQRLLDAVVSNISTTVPGLLAVGGREGLVDPASLLDPAGLGWTAAIALAVGVVASMGWIGAVRDGLRSMFGLAPLRRNPFVAKAVDLGVLLLLAVALLLSAALTLLLGVALDTVAELAGFDGGAAAPLGYGLGVLAAAVLNWCTAAILFSLAARLEISRAAFWQATGLAGAAATVLQLLSGLLLARAGANPVLAPFAVVIGLLLWFNFLSQAYLGAAAWAAVGESDAAALAHSRPRPGRARTIAR
ncbi:YhjD/YihY/BrkB family envelope integrity protein [Pseudarthrobacter sp. P1]|uniref:YhjD/YihY/BrkB family envelope integrity protein n=1 Tax=Pseudarthrobacter sp. P1 TaxID=3418418 RepID=UPI003CE804B0